MGRATQGVRLINLRNNDEIAAVTKVSADIIETEEELLDEENMSNEELTNETLSTDETTALDETTENTENQ
jgi:DNA gyrase subunit A